MFKKKLAAVAMAFCLVATFTACGDSSDSSGSDDTKEEASGETSEESEEAEEESSTGFADNVLTTDKYTITITDYKVIPAGEPGNEYSDKPVIAFWYDVNNISDEDLDPSNAWIWVFTAIQDNDPDKVNELEMGSLPDEQFLDSQMEKIKIGGTVSNAVAYELDDTETPVTLKAEELLGDSYGEQTFELK